MKTLIGLCLTVLLLVSCSDTTKEKALEGYDIVILNGRVMDPETEFDAVRNVGIKDGIIITITEDEISGKETVDAKGLVVTAGFIDTHTHSSNMYNIKMSMMDGVTTGLDLEAGAVNIGAWYEREKGKWPMNYGQCVSQEVVRMMIHDGLDITEPADATNMFDARAEAAKDGVNGWSVSVSDLDQLNAISKILDENLRQGALGIGSTIGYAAKGISTYEMFEAQRTAARYGRLTAFHTRFHASTKTPTEATLGFDEAFTNACLLDAPLLICHDNDYGWWEIEEKLVLARDKGMNMWAEYYPYDAGSTSIGSTMFQPAMLEGILGLVYEDVIYDPSLDKFLSKDDYLEIVKKDPGRTIIAFNPSRQEWMKSWIKMPHMVVGSDAMWSTDDSHNWETDPTEFAGHPRTSGTHCTVLRLGREANVPLMFTLSQLSYWSALHLGDAGIESMKVRGRMQEGMVADIVIFDAKTVKQGSSYKAGEHGLPSIGMLHVVVNGVFVKKDNKATDKFPGEPIRYPVEEKGKFEPATKKQWLKEHTIDTSPLKPKS